MKEKKNVFCFIDKGINYRKNDTYNIHILMKIEEIYYRGKLVLQNM